MDHPERNTLRAFLSDSLQQSQEELVASHLDTCESCRLIVEELIDDTFNSLGLRTLSATKHDRSRPAVESTTAKSLPEFVLGSRFMVLSELARGGIGIVYRGFDRELQREVAIKVLQDDNHEAVASRFYREARITGQLQHPGVVPVYESGKMRDGRFFIALKMIEGQTLSSLIRSDKNNLTKHLDVFGSISQTMAFAHSRNAIHRDLKPANIMVGTFGEVQVLDWGLARILDTPSSETESSHQDQSAATTLPGATLQGDVLGTPAYIPPEQARGDRADKRTDVFGLGGILCEILTGVPPFDAPTSTVALQKSVSSDLLSTFKRLDQSGADECLIDLVKSCLAAHPDDRPVDAQAVSHQFAQYLENRELEFETAKLEKARTAERLIAQQKRNRQVAWFSTAIIGVLLALVFAGYLYLTEKNRRETAQAQAELEEVKRRDEAENQIRLNVASAKSFRELAMASDSKVTSKHWQSALFEIKQANSLKTSIESELLRKELEALRHQIQNESSVFFEFEQREEQEFNSHEKIRKACYESLYPPELRLALLDRLTDDFAQSYAEIGVTPGDLSDEVVSRISNSRYHPYLMHGLLIWGVEVARESRRYGPRDNDDSVREWIGSLLAKAETDPLRIKIRKAIRDREYQQIGPLMQTKEATGSLATVLLCAPLVEYMDDTDERIDYLLRAQLAYPNEFQTKWELSAVHGLGSEEQTELALRSALACQSLQPENPGVLMNLGVTYIQQRNYAQAIELLEQVVEIAPKFTDARYNLANAYWQDGQLDPALKTCVEILDESKEYFWATLLKALIHEKKGQIDEAIIEFQNATVQNTKHITAYHRLFEIYWKRKEADKALKHLKKAVELAPDYTPYLKQLASAYRTMKQWDLAEETYGRILKRNPRDTDALASLANFYLSLKKPEQGETLLRDAIYNGVNGHTIQLELAKALLAQSDKDRESPKQIEAIRILRKLIEFSPNLKEPATILRKRDELE